MVKGLMLLLAFLSRAQVVDPDSRMPFLPDLPTPPGLASASFIQSEQVRTWKALSILDRPMLKKGWAVMDSFQAEWSPQINADLSQANAGNAFTLYRGFGRGIRLGAGFSGMAKGLYNTAPEEKRWDNESDRARLSVKGVAAPGADDFLALNLGLQSNGNRNAETMDRGQGFFYECRGTALLPFEPVRGARLSLLEAADFVRDNRFHKTRLEFGGRKPLGPGSAVVATGNYSRTDDAAYFVEPTLRTDRFAAFKFIHRPSWGRESLMVSLSENRFDYPDAPERDRRERVWSLAYLPDASWKRLRIEAAAGLTGGGAAFAYGEETDPHPPADRLAVARAQLFNEESRETLLASRLSLDYFRGHRVFWSLFRNMRRFDYPYRYTDPGGLTSDNPDKRDLLIDNDTFALFFPALDTGTFTLSRSSRLINYVDSRRSQDNRLSTTWQMSLNHALKRPGIVHSRVTALLAVSEDSLFYPISRAAQNRLYRKREVWLFSDVDALPGFRSEADSAILTASYGFEEDGLLDREAEVRIFIPQKFYHESGLNLMFQKAFLGKYSLAAGIFLSRTLGTYANNSGAASELSTAREGYLSAEGRFGRLHTLFQARKIQSFFDHRATRNYLTLNLKALVEY